MSDTEQKTPNKTGASGAAWSDAEKIAYLLVLCENDGKVESKIAAAPIPAGRSIIACKKLFFRLKEKHKDVMEKIKAGEALTAGSATSAAGDGAATFEKPKTPRKRKSKDDTEGDADDETPMKKATPRKKKGDTEGATDETPKKKAAPRKKKSEAAPIKQEVIETTDEIADEEV